LVSSRKIDSNLWNFFLSCREDKMKNHRQT